MSESSSFFSQLMQRRVPQIVGAYVAGLWLAVELGGWVTEQLGLPSVYALYLFVLLAALLPSVVLLAWRHGQPGPDTWGRPEKIAVPANGLLAVALVVAVVGMRPPEEPPETARARAAIVERTLIDEEGQEQVFQVVREGYGVSVLIMFWPRDGEPTAEPSWESYAAPWLLSVDLAQDPLISGGVVFDRSIIERLQAAGFAGALGEPLALSLGIAAEGAADFLIRGGFEAIPEGYRLRADIHALADGSLVDSVVADGSTLIAAADRLGEQVAQRLVGDLDRGDVVFRPVSLNERTTSEPEAVAPFIQGVKALVFDSDYESAVALLQTAVDIDPSFAQAWAWLQQVHRLAGNMAAASAASQQALSHDYKLSTELRFILRANQYAIGGDVDRAVRVLRMWTEVEPHSLQAWTTLTRNLLLLGEVDEAREANEAAKSIDPDRASLDRTRANIEELAGNFDLASRILEGYLEAEPQDAAAWISLGNVRERAGDLDGAREAYDRAGFVASNAFQSRRSLLRLEARAGDPEEAVRRFQRALEQPLQPSEATALVTELSLLLGNLGRMEELLDLIDQRESVFGQTMAPMTKTLTLEGLRAGALTQLGRFDEALGRLDRAEEGMAGPFGSLFAHARIPIYAETGQLNAAREALERLRAVVENSGMVGQDALVESATAQVLAAEGDYEGALERLDHADRMLQGTSMSQATEITEPMLVQRAEYEIELGRAEAALDRLDELLAKHPNHAPAQFQRARALSALERGVDARAQLDRLTVQLASADADFQLLVEANELARNLDRAH